MKRLSINAQLCPQPNGEDALGTLGLVRACVIRAPKEGLGLDDVKKRLRVLEAVEKADAAHLPHVDLEDADAETLQACVRDFRWGAVHADIVKFTDGVSGMKAPS